MGEFCSKRVAVGISLTTNVTGFDSTIQVPGIVASVSIAFTKVLFIYFFDIEVDKFACVPEVPKSAFETFVQVVPPSTLICHK